MTDGSQSLAAWQRAAENDPVLPDLSLNDLQRLRQREGAEVASAMVELARARAKLAAKWAGGEGWVADVAGAEMASSEGIARWKAKRFRSAGGVQDLCCGIGADARAMVDAGLEVVAVDANEVRAWTAGLNSGASVRCADVTEDGVLDRSVAYHCDPSRRDLGRDKGRRGKTRLDDLLPGRAFLESLAEMDGCLKLSPASDIADLPAGEIEFVSEGGRLRQCLVWTGGMAQDDRRASLVLNSGEVASMAGAEADAGRAAGLGRFAYTFDPSAERAGLVWVIADRHGLLHFGDPGAGLLTGDTLVSDPFVRAFEVIEEMAWQPRRVAKALAGLGAGEVEVKTRGKAVDPDVEQKRLRGTGDERLTVFVQRFDGVAAGVRALVVRRV